MRILLVVDFSPASDERVAELAARTLPTGSIVRVLAIVDRTPPSAAELWFDALGSLEKVMAERRKRPEELVLKSSAVLREKGFTVETSVRAGRRHKETSLDAKSWRADEIIRG